MRPQETNTDFRRTVLKTNLQLTPLPPPDYAYQITQGIESLTLGPIPEFREFSTNMVTWVKDGIEMYQTMNNLGLGNLPVLAVDFEYHIEESYDGTNYL